MPLCVVTGGAGALGADVARALVRRGDDVALVDMPRARERMDALVKELGTKASAHTGIESALARGPVEFAALIAGGWAGGAPLHEAKDDAAFRAMMDSNVATVHAALRAFLPGMVARKRGAIVVVGSRNVERPWTGKGSAEYTASKAAAVAMAQAASAEVLEHGVRVNAILPSTMDTPANRTSMPDADVTRWVTTSSAAGVVAFLLSDAARDISGAAIPLYGRA
ncbi:MAG TPA: SDR family NAD(P)-dependent oxidoreductase [Polyangiaceae bacterium]